MKRSRPIAYTFLAFSCLVSGAGATENCSAEGTNSNGKPYHIALSSAWTDKEMLETLGLDIRKSKMSKSLGPDGEGRTYMLGRKTINIVRSHSTGIYVMLHIKNNGMYVEWYLQSCQLGNSLHKKADELELKVHTARTSAF